MFQHYLRFLLRKQSVFTAINFGGLVIGMTAALLLFRYVRYEQTYDRQSPHADHIWRVFNQTVDGQTVVTEDANTHSAVGPALKADVADVVDYARLYCGNSPEMVVLAENKPFEVARCYATDPGFLRMFPPQGLHGDLARSLDEPYRAVLTRTQAERLFGTADAVGRVLRISEGMLAAEYAVAAVVADPPENTHLKFNLLVSYATKYALGHQDNFDSYWDYNYIQLAPGAGLESVRQKLADINGTHLKNEGIRLEIQRFADIHLHSALTYELEPNGSARIVHFLGLIALLILGIAFVNYVNLATAFAGARGKEVGIRKAVGAGRGAIAGQFLLESLLVSAAAFGVAAVLYRELLPTFSDLLGRPLAASAFDWGFWGISGGLAVALALLTGWYPALQLAAFRPSETLRGQLGIVRGNALRKGLVVAQFACSAGLIFGVLVVGRQLDFLKKHDLGAQIEQVVTLKSVRRESHEDTLSVQKLALFKTACGQMPGVRGMALSSMAPGVGINGISGSNRPLRWTQQPGFARGTSYFVNTDEHFFDFFGIRVLAGEHRFHTDQAARYRNVSINQAMLHALGFPSPEAAVGQQIAYENSEGGATMTVAAVVEDFHIESLKTTPKPTLYYCFAPEQLHYLSLKVAPENMETTLAAMQRAWSGIYPDKPFRYWFLDEHFAQQYRQETQFARVFGLFAGLAIVISCLGLLGLAAYNVRRRRKEIGIRKVLGGTVTGIAALLVRDFLKLVLLAALVATPAAYYLLEDWLADFAYRIAIPWWLAAAAASVVVGTALATVSFQSMRAALADPVDSLRSE